MGEDVGCCCRKQAFYEKASHFNFWTPEIVDP